MKIIERIISKMKEKKITQETLANELNIKQGVIAMWKNRGTTPPMEYLPTICKVLDVSWEYIVTGEESDERLSNAEQRLLTYYRASNANGRGKIEEYASDIATLHPAKQREEEQRIG